MYIKCIDINSGFRHILLYIEEELELTGGTKLFRHVSLNFLADCTELETSILNSFNLSSAASIQDYLKLIKQNASYP